jgi:hypothetical protein
MFDHHCNNKGEQLILDKQNQGPQCTACGSPLTLTAIEPGASGQDRRTFICGSGPSPTGTWPTRRDNADPT